MCSVTIFVCSVTMKNWRDTVIRICSEQFTHFYTLLSCCMGLWVGEPRGTGSCSPCMPQSKQIQTKYLLNFNFHCILYICGSSYCCIFWILINEKRLLQKSFCPIGIELFHQLCNIIAYFPSCRQKKEWISKEKNRGCCDDSQRGI